MKITTTKQKDYLNQLHSINSAALGPAAVDDRRGEYFWKETATVNEGCEADGNQFRDGRWTYTLDAENRLVAINPVNGLPAGADWLFRFGYDAKGRRITKTSEQWNGSTWVLITSSRFVYDGWNLLAELTAANAVLRSYVWGLDLSGVLQGAGGVGGLLEVNDAANGAHFVAYDGNGNVVGLVAVGPTSGGTVTASYEYGPFGELVRLSGTMAKLNPIRFSSKYQDEQTDLLYYGYRYYNPGSGRWLSRDPIGELSEGCLYAYAHNDGIYRYDMLGLFDSGTSLTYERIACKALKNGARTRANPIACTTVVVGTVAVCLVAEDLTVWNEIKKLKDENSRSDEEIWRMEEALQKRYERKAYSRRCTESTPEGLDPCSEAVWKLQRNRDCQKMRTDFEKKWFGEDGHPDEMKNLDTAINKLEQWIKDNCTPGCCR